MKNKKNEPDKSIKKKVEKKIKKEAMQPVFENYEDVQRLVHLLQVHQVELEHQNEELRIAQEELEVSRNKYVNLFDFSPIPYFALNPDGKISEVNLSASKMFVIERGKLIGKKFISFVQLEDMDIFNRFIKNIFDLPEKHSCELNVISKDKRMFHVLLEGLELDEAPGSGKKCQIALIDLTEHKRLSDSLKKSFEEHKALNSTKDKFFSIIAHDLRSPFQSLLSSTELLSTEIESLTQEEIISFSSGLHDDLKNLLALLDNLLQWSLMQRNLLKYKPETLNLYEVVNKTIEMLNQSAVKKNISISNNVANGTLVYADVDMVHSIVQNLIINAIKFTNAKGKITVSSTKKDGHIEVYVQDSGIGIDLERSSDMFNIYTLSSSTGTAGERGTGLGLSLCKEFVERNGGKIWVESELGKGTKFAFTLNRGH